MARRITIVRIVLGTLLLTAAALKLYGLSVSAIPRVGWFAQSWLQLAAFEWELLLGVWLLSGASPRLSWLAALVTFMAFAGVSGYLGWVGVASCGCFGKLQASPWYAFGVDLTALALLAIARPQATTSSEQGPVLGGGLKWLAGGAVVLIALTALGSGVYGSPEAAMAHLRGESLTVSPGHLDFGDGRPSEDLESTVEVRNWTDQPVRLIGGTSDCSCVVTRGLPVTIPPGGSVTVPIHLRLPAGSSGAFTRTAVIVTDRDRERTVRLTVGGRSVGDPGMVP